MQIKTNKTSPISISTQERAMKFVGLCLIAACFWPFSALAYKISCPEGWTSFSQSPSCYLLYTGKEETFNDAKEICENHDATLAIIDSVPEKDRLATLVGQVTRKHFWVGLNYIDDKWLWLDNTTVDNSIM